VALTVGTIVLWQKAAGRRDCSALEPGEIASIEKNKVMIAQ
jgi:hypothetical protein